MISCINSFKIYPLNCLEEIHKTIYPIPFTFHLPDNVNLATRFIYLPFSSHLPENKGFQNVIYNLQIHSKCFVDTSLHIIKCLNCKVLYNLLINLKFIFLEFSIYLPITQKIRGFKMWFNLLQNNSKCFIYTSLHTITLCNTLFS